MKDFMELKKWAEENHFSDFNECHFDKDVMELVDRMDTSREINYSMTEKEIFEKGLNKCFGYGIIELKKGPYVCPIKIIYECKFENYLEDYEQFGESGATIIGWEL